MHGDKPTELTELPTVPLMVTNSDMELYKETPTHILTMDRPPVFLTSEVFKCNQLWFKEH